MAQFEYQVGGSLQANHPTYVHRQADADLLTALHQGQFCYTFNSRQMGKSSLLVQTKHRLEQQGARAAVIDMTCIGSELVTAEQWYKGLAYELWLGFELMEQFSLKAWWQEQKDLALPQRLTQLLRHILWCLPKQPLLILIDEIDSVLSLPFAIDDFFALIRFCYNQRALEPDFNRLAFALFGVATPSDLVQDRSKTPFNIGQAIDLQGFQLHEVEPLVQTLTGKVSNPSALLQQVLGWTEGQPFLTQKLCQLILSKVQAGFLTLPPGTEAFWIDNLVTTELLQNWEAQDEPEHLRTIRDRLLHNAQRAGRLLGLYQQIWLRDQVDSTLGSSALGSSALGSSALGSSTNPTLTNPEKNSESSRDQIELLLSGLVVRQQGYLQVKNQIYRRVFDQAWINQQLRTLRPYAPALEAWVAAGQQDDSRLLRGQALLDAQAWAQDKSLSDIDYQFLAASQQAEQQDVQQMLEVARLQQVETQLQAERQSSRQQRFWLKLVSAKLLLISLLSGLMFYQYRRAALNEVKAIATASETYYSAHQGLDALIAALQANRKLQQIGRADLATAEQVAKVLRQAVYNASEVSRFNAQQTSMLSLAASPNQKLLVSGGVDRTVRLWQSDGKLLKTLYGHSDQVTAVAFSSDSRLIASASADQTIILWDQNGNRLHRLIGHSGTVRSVAFNPASSEDQLVSAGQDGQIRRWSSTGKLLKAWKGHQSSINALAFSPDGQMLATASDDQTLRLWTLSGQLLKTLRGHTDRVRTLAFSPNADTLVSGSDDSTVKIWTINGQPIHTLTEHQAAVQAIAFSPFGDRMATASRDRSIKLWNRDGVLLATLRGHTRPLASLAFIADGRTLVSSSEDETIRLWQVKNSFLTPLVGHQASVTAITFNPIDRSVITGSADRTVRIWNRRGTLLRQINGHQAEVTDVAVSSLVNPAVNRAAKDSLIATASADRTVKLWNRDGLLLHNLTGHRASVRSVQFSPNGQVIASSGDDKTIRLWRKDGEVTRVLSGHGGAVADVAFSLLAPMLASVSVDGGIRIWRSNAVATQSSSQTQPWRNDGDLLTSFGDYSVAITAVAFNPQRSQLATAWDKTIQIWDATDRTLLKTLRGHRGKIRDLAFSPDGRLLASASEDNTVKLWTVKLSTVKHWSQSGKPLTTLDSHSHAVRSLAFSPDSQMLASASDDQTGLLWDLQLVLNTKALYKQGCEWLQVYLRNPELSAADRQICSKSAKPVQD
jgi:WD40 repeat protein